MAMPNDGRGLWQPPAETLEALAAVLRKHWRAAAGNRYARLFWPTPARWLRTGLTASVPVITGPATAPQVTTSLSAAD